MHVSLIMLTEISNQHRPINLPSFVRSRIRWKCQVFLFCVCSRCCCRRRRRRCSGMQHARREWEKRKEKKNEQQQLKTITKTNQRQNKTRKSFLRVSQIVHRLNCTLNRHHMQRAWHRARVSRQAEHMRLGAGIHRREVDLVCVWVHVAFSCQCACNLDGCSTAAVKANLIISFPFFTFVVDRNLDEWLRSNRHTSSPIHIHRHSHMLSSAHTHIKSKMNLHFEMLLSDTHITATAPPKRSLQISLPQIFSVSQSKICPSHSQGIGVFVFLFAFNCVRFLCPCMCAIHLVFRVSNDKSEARAVDRMNGSHGTLVIA